ncbi:MAG: hypothetical protein IT583_03620 [Verrucomicrobia bacterium]|nr:hypothetical protein [Verrucomicrobiota bacterium]
MKKRMVCLLLSLTGAFGLPVTSVFADLGLAQVAASQGTPAVGQTVLSSAQAIYANNTDPAAIESQLIAILNEAVATGDERIIRYAIVAVMMAGGEANAALARRAINSSNAFTSYQTLTAVTVAAVESLLTGGGGGLPGVAGGGGGGGGDPKSQGGGQNPLFKNQVDPNNPFTWGTLTGGGDNDLPATRT